MIYKLLRPAIFSLDAERAHRLTLETLKLAPLKGAQDPGSLAVDVAGLRFPNPVGMAAGFDKDGEVPDAVLGLGFGFTEIGSLTPRPQAGNPKPRLFRLREDRAVINRMGFNNGGLPAALPRLEKRRDRPGIVGINIGANKDSDDRIGDYAVLARALAPFASYLAINVSSPNTPGLRALQDPQALGALIDGVMDAAGKDAPPVFLKVAPDLASADIDDIAKLAVAKRLGALIVSNTTTARPGLKSRHASEAGGLSGAPLRDLAQQSLRDFRAATGGQVPLIGVGGVASADDAWARIRAGASLVQLYTALVYEGPGLARRIVTGLDRLMKRDGFSSIAEAVGTE